MLSELAQHLGRMDFILAPEPPRRGSGPVDGCVWITSGSAATVAMNENDGVQKGRW